MTLLSGSILAAILVVIWLTTQYVVVPYIRLETRRNIARKRTPQPEDIYIQDGDLLYVDAVTPMGVELMTFNPRTKQFNRWRDSWAEWAKRCELRVVWYTGQRRPLGPE